MGVGRMLGPIGSWRFLFGTFFLLATVCCFADEPDLRNEVLFKFENGQPVEVDYRDGRVAEWVMGKRPVKQFPTRYQVTENTCTGVEGVRGEFLLTFQANSFELRWRQHPKVEMVGKTVGIKPKTAAAGTTFSEVKDDFQFLTNDAQSTAPLLTKDFPADAFRASDFSWLPGGGAEPPDAIEFTRWDTEFMQTNPETGLNENRTFTVATHPKLVRSDGLLELREFGGGTPNPFGGTRFLLFVGDIWSIILKNGDEFCQISTKSNLADLQLEAAKYLGLVPTLAPYIYGSDEYSQALMPFIFKNYVEKWKEYDVE